MLGPTDRIPHSTKTVFPDRIKKNLQKKKKKKKKKQKHSIEKVGRKTETHG